MWQVGPTSDRALARQLFQVRKGRVNRASANVGGIFDHAVEPSIHVENGAFAQFAVTSVRLARAKAQAGDVTHPSADGTLHRFGQRSLMHAERIVEIGLHECQQFAAVITRIGLDSTAVIDGHGGFSAVLAASRTRRKRDRQQQDQRALCGDYQVRPVRSSSVAAVLDRSSAKWNSHIFGPQIDYSHKKYRPDIIGGTMRRAGLNPPGGGG